MWALVFGALLIANLAWLGWNWLRGAELRAAGEQFKVKIIHTNDTLAVDILNAKTHEPIWIESYSDHDQKPDLESYFFHGKNVFNLHLREHGAPKYDVIFYGAGKSAVCWWDMGSGSFTERVSYDTNGTRSGFEVWYSNAWHSVGRRSEKNGIIINGQWFHLKLDTNGMWTTDAEATMRTNHP